MTDTFTARRSFGADATRGDWVATPDWTVHEVEPTTGDELWSLASTAGDQGCGGIRTRQPHGRDP